MATSHLQLSAWLRGSVTGRFLLLLEQKMQQLLSGSYCEAQVSGLGWLGASSIGVWQCSSCCMSAVDATLLLSTHAQCRTDTHITRICYEAACNTHAVLPNGAALPSDSHNTESNGGMC